MWLSIQTPSSCNKTSPSLFISKTNKTQIFFNHLYWLK